MSWSTVLLSEYLSSCLLILLVFLHLEIQNSKEPRRWQLGLIFVLDLAIMFTRPALLLLPAAIHSYFFLIRRIRKFHILGVVLCATSVLTWCTFVNLQTGRFEVSRIGRINQLGRILVLARVDKSFCDSNSCSKLTERALGLLSLPGYKRNSPHTLAKDMTKIYPEYTWNQVVDTLNKEIGPHLKTKIAYMSLRRFLGSFFSKKSYTQGVQFPGWIKIYKSLSKAEYLLLMFSFIGFLLLIRNYTNSIWIISSGIVVYSTGISSIAAYSESARMMVAAYPWINLLGILALKDIVLLIKAKRTNP